MNSAAVQNANSGACNANRGTQLPRASDLSPSTAHQPMTHVVHDSALLMETARVLAQLVVAEASADACLRVSSALQTLTSCDLLEGELATEVVSCQGVG